MLLSGACSPAAWVDRLGTHPRLAARRPGRLPASFADTCARSTAAAGPAGRLPGLHQLGLTPRDREALALVANGRSNRQITEALFVSPKTAGVHLSNILAKLGVAGRVDRPPPRPRLRPARSRQPPDQATGIGLAQRDPGDALGAARAAPRIACLLAGGAGRVAGPGCEPAAGTPWRGSPAQRHQPPAWPARSGRPARRSGPAGRTRTPAAGGWVADALLVDRGGGTAC
jgi:DNA-binding CsgD family transcriptional regulator